MACAGSLGLCSWESEGDWSAEGGDIDVGRCVMEKYLGRDCVGVRWLRWFLRSCRGGGLGDVRIELVVLPRLGSVG